MVIGGETRHTATALASASLTYYVLTAACLSLGFAGLVFGDRLSRWLVPRFLLSSVAIAWLLTIVRFLLEKSAAPPSSCASSGSPGWRPSLAPTSPAASQASRASGIASRDRWRLTRSWSAGSSPPSGVTATLERLGSHYDVSGVTAVRLALTDIVYSFEPGSAVQLLWLTIGTAAPGLAGAHASPAGSSAPPAAALVLRAGLPGRPRFSAGPEWRRQAEER